MLALQLGPLSAIVTPVLSASEVKKTFVLLHGYGAPGSDLVGLAQAIDAPAGTRFVFLQAPHTLDGMSGSHAGRAWWHIDMMALQIARMTGQDDALASAVPEGLHEARDMVEQALVVLEKEHGLDWTTLVIGGFSQGAMLSCDWALRSERSIEALVQLSGTVICESDWLQLMKARAGLRVFQSHSPDDQVLPFSLAERHRDTMTRAGLKNTFVSFRGGHGIAPPVIQALARFLAEPSASSQG
jgi:phospholipase/carboxylesterase